MLSEKPQDLLEEALSWLDEISELAEALLMAIEQMEAKPEHLPDRLHFLLDNCHSKLLLVHGEAKVCISSSLSRVDRLEAALKEARQAGSRPTNGQVVSNGKLPERS